MAQSSKSFLQEPSTRIEHPGSYLISNYSSGALVKFQPQEPAEGPLASWHCLLSRGRMKWPLGFAPRSSPNLSSYLRLQVIGTCGRPSSNSRGGINQTSSLALGAFPSAGTCPGINAHRGLGSQKKRGRGQERGVTTVEVTKHAGNHFNTLGNDKGLLLKS
jgi:hypothetical protein